MTPQSLTHQPPSRITAFDGEHVFLSNFHPSRSAHNDVRLTSSPGATKHAGWETPLREDWETIKDDVMRVGLRLKFARGSGLARLLLATGEAELVEGNTWGDEVWGVVWRDGSCGVRTAGREPARSPLDGSAGNQLRSDSENENEKEW